MARIKQVRKPLSFLESCTAQETRVESMKECNCAMWLPSTDLLPAGWELAKDAHSLYPLHLWRNIAGKEIHLLKGRAERLREHWTEKLLPVIRESSAPEQRTLLTILSPLLFWTRIYIYIYYGYACLSLSLCIVSVKAGR